MDQIKTGAFIAELRRERKLTQEQLGELLNVTNKTISRWETGTYMPPIESLEALSKELGVSINEIIAGERLSDESFRRVADENISKAWQDSTFTLKERQGYFKKRWIKAHVFHYIALAGAAAAVIVFVNPLIGYVLGSAGIFALRNSMQGYIERKVFDPQNIYDT